MCRCAEGVVDCRDKSLSRIPPYLPDSATELWVFPFNFFPISVDPHYLVSLLWLGGDIDGHDDGVYDADDDSQNDCVDGFLALR